MVLIFSLTRQSIENIYFPNGPCLSNFETLSESHSSFYVILAA